MRKSHKEYGPICRIESQIRSQHLQAVNDGPRSPRARSPTKARRGRTRATTNPSSAAWTRLRESKRLTRCNSGDRRGPRKNPATRAPLVRCGKDVQDLRRHVLGFAEKCGGG